MTKFTGPNLVMASGILALWTGAALFIWTLLWGPLFWGHVDSLLSISFLAYILSTIACGIAFIWADRVARSTNNTKPRSTRLLVHVGLGSLLVPWIVLPIVFMLIDRG